MCDDLKDQQDNAQRIGYAIQLVWANREVEAVVPLNNCTWNEALVCREGNHGVVIRLKGGGRK